MRWCYLLVLLLGALGASIAPAADPKIEAREALWAAVRAGDEKVIAAALDKGGDVNAKNEYGITAMWIAASKGKTEVIELLLARGADPSARDGIWYQTPLSQSLNKLENVKVLLKAGAKDVDAAVIAAAGRGNLPILQAVLDGAKAKQETLDAALFATAETQKEIRAALTKAGAKPLPVVDQKDRDAWQQFAGSYESEYGGVLKVEVKDTGLVTVSGTSRVAYKPTGPGAFAPLGVEESSLTFERKSEKVVRVISRRFTAEAAYFPQGSKPVPKEPVAPKEIAGAKVVTPANWPQFRGIDSTGVADGQDPPLTWDAKTGTNILWKTPVPGLGHSCPVIWGDRVFLTSAVGGNTELKTGNYGDPNSVKDDSKLAFQVVCLDRVTGKILWTKTAFEGVPKIKRHLKGSHANCTAATDGRRVVACFGSEGLYCYDFDGKLLWTRDLGTLDSSFALEQQYEWGFAASPIIHEDRVILQCDLSRDSFIAAYSLADGSRLWTTPRDEIPSWSSPAVWRNAKRVEIVTNASQFARGYDPATGKELWRLDKKSEATVPTPVLTPELAFVVSGNRPIQPLFAIKPGATGDISLKADESANTHVAWGKLRGGPYMPTPIVYQKYLYTIGNGGMVTCYEAATGKELYKERVGGTSYTASPVAADGRLYFTSEQGEIRVVKAGPEFELLAVNKMGDVCMATPAICGGALFVRTKDALVAVSRK
ncbi:PQQ-binding-like beta-propeller repeat protein [Gemmata sp. G18]|uniref:PQQ-binding-like beta-propeller repeat protein n=1 Tax=Gemmata palustris TaxID=2822762 RepID=A0ABS5BSK7_9BACT|nr:PQQ-binding-like beta-propeller repeat protein [Gemmata palustris]MBP3956397.1 PQQ-binding-like beta-propeller repeat protein [Gemmata palustris]